MLVLLRYKEIVYFYSINEHDRFAHQKKKKNMIEFTIGIIIIKKKKIKIPFNFYVQLFKTSPFLAFSHFFQKFLRYKYILAHF